ncbi:MAG: thioesterase family protein [Betaproteobacteria bacterium]
MAETAIKSVPLRRDEFPHHLPIDTRWSDNDAYGHLNNVVFYSYFDTVVNQYLITRGVLDIDTSPVIGLVVETGCNYFASAAFPEKLQAGLRVARLGNSSVRFEIALFREGSDDAIAQGHFVHVYVGRETRRPVRLPSQLREVLSRIQVSTDDQGSP